LEGIPFWEYAAKMQNRQAANRLDERFIWVIVIIEELKNGINITNSSFERE
jgi:hypothetical protein